jgi:hypothetical protein
MKCKECGYDWRITFAQVERRARDYCMSQSGARDVDVFVSKRDFETLVDDAAPFVTHSYSGTKTPTLTMRGAFGAIRIWPYDGNAIVVGEVQQ